MLNNPSLTLLGPSGGFLALLLKLQHLYLLKLLFHCLINIQEILVDRVALQMQDIKKSLIVGEALGAVASDDEDVGVEGRQLGLGDG